MKNGLAILAAGTILFLAIGWYQDWYRVDRAASRPGFYNVHVGIHTNKVGDDCKYVSDQVEQGGQWIQAKCQDMRNTSDNAAAPKVEQPHQDPTEESSNAPMPRPVPNKWK